MLLRPGLRIQIHMNPHNFWNMDPDPHLSQNSKALEAQNRAVENRGRSQWRPGGSNWSHGESIDQESQIAITLKRLDPNPGPHYSEKLDLDLLLGCAVHFPFKRNEAKRKRIFLLFASK
jgi:hypothetical protein